jgi:hypothetical protein
VNSEFSVNSIIYKRFLLLQAVLAYPLVAKTLRDNFSTNPKKEAAPKSCSSHRCGMSYFAQDHSTGYPDLDELTRHPKDLKFTFG